MSKEFNARLQLKYDTYENWNTNNPVLLAGEMAVVVVPDSTGVVQNEPTVLFKVGDGSTNFNNLKWASGLAGDVYAWAKASTKPTYTAEEITGLEDYISGAIQDTDTQYKIVKTGNLSFKLQSKPKTGGDWTDTGETIDLTETVHTLIEGTENGTIKFDGKDVKVHGLGSAAYTETSAYDAAGSANTAKTEANQYTDSVKTALIGTDNDEGTMDTIKGAKKYADSAISAKLSSTYKPGGSVQFAKLPELNAENEGKVYNVTNAFTTNENFIEGAGSSYPAGTNVVCINSNNAGAYKWDVLAGFVDLSEYETANETKVKIDAAKSEAIETAKTYTNEKNGEINAALNLKANDADLHKVAKTGKIEDLVQTDFIIFNCGSSTTNI